MAYAAKGMVRGVCAGIADYLGVPVKLVRILVVLSIFFGLAFFYRRGLYRPVFCTGPSAG